jgi:DNA-binding YbaB/EbfC family protein
LTASEKSRDAESGCFPISPIVAKPEDTSFPPHGRFQELQLQRQELPLMFKRIGNIFSLMKQAQEMQGRMGEIQEKLKHVRVEGTAGGGMVTVEANGQQKVLHVRIEDSLLQDGDKEMLEDLLVGAVNSALEKAREAAAEEMAKLTGDLDLPGLNEAIQKLKPGASDVAE